LFLQFGFLVSNISFRYRGSKTKTFLRLEPKTSRIRTAEGEASRAAGHSISTDVKQFRQSRRLRWRSLPSRRTCIGVVELVFAAVGFVF
jgi:hypothetical protein